MSLAPRARAVAPIPLVLLLLAAAPAGAADDAGVRCLAAKLRVAGRVANRMLRCHAAAAAAGTAVDAACLAKGRSRLLATLATIGHRGGCGADDGPERVAAEVEALATATAHLLRPLGDASPCQAAKLRSAGRHAAGSLRGHAANLQRGAPARLQDRIAGLRAALARRFLVAESTGEACAPAPDAVTALAAVEGWLDGVMASLRVVGRSTVTLPSPVAPPHTPGSPGVTVGNPKLLTQFGGASFSLNNVTCTRWRLAGPERPARAVLIAVPGFGGGAGNFEILAENLITRMLEDHGLLVEVWGYDRRTEQLEDRAGLLIAGALGDPLVALDWYYGAELGLPLSPALAAGPNRRAVFYNTTSDVPFIADWTSLVFSRDIDVAVEAARTATGNVFLAGHSAGTSFAARYAATDLNLTGVGPADPGYAKLRGIVLFEGGGGSTGGVLSADSLDRIIAKHDGGLFGAVRDGAPRCVDGTRPCAVASEAVDCAGLVPPRCTPPVAAHGVILGIQPQVLAAAEPAGVQALTDPDGGQAILQVDQGAPGNNAIDQVPALGLISVLPAGTVDALFGSFLDDDGIFASVSAAIASSLGASGPVVGGLATWLDLTEAGSFPPCPGAGCVTPDNGPPPTTLPGGVWGVEREVTRLDRLRSSFAGVEGANSSDWYYPISGLGVTSVAGVCTAGTCTVGNVGASCATNGACNQAVSLDSTPLSIGRGRPDIENLTQAAAIDVPVLCVGGSNGLTPVPGRFVPFAASIGACAAASCSGAPRIVDELLPSAAFPTFGGAAGGFEVVIAEGFAHIDVVSAEDDAANPVVRTLSDFMARNTE